MDTNADRGSNTKILTHNVELRALDMFNAFTSTLRARIKKMRKAISKHYSVNISNLV